MNKPTKNPSGISMKYHLTHPDFLKDRRALENERVHFEAKWREITISKQEEYERCLRAARESSEKSGVQMSPEDFDQIDRAVFTPQEQAVRKFMTFAQTLLKEFDRAEAGAIKKAYKFNSGRGPGALQENTKYIDALVKKYPELPAKLLFDKATPALIGDITFATFQKKISESRKRMKAVKPKVRKSRSQKSTP